MEVLLLCAVLSCLVPMGAGDVPPGIRDTICLTRRGTCRLFFCRSGEKGAEICSDPWNRCCVANAEGEKAQKPAET